MKAINDKKLGKYQEAIEQAKEKLIEMQKRLKVSRDEEQRLRVREQKVVAALQKAREVIKSLQKGS